jgi:3-hydroxypropanoate dehydrogenase
MTATLNDDALDLLFRNARTHSEWLDKPVPEGTLRQLYDLMKWGPTSANSSPARILFLRSPESRRRLLPALSPGNIEKTLGAPVTAIIGYDTRFYEQLPTLFPHADARSWFAGNPELSESTAQRNSALQGAYFIIAARALGLDCGPMSGFDQAKVDQEFFSAERESDSGHEDRPVGLIKSNFLVNLGYGNSGKVKPRNPRLEFDEVCAVL